MNAENKPKHESKGHRELKRKTTIGEILETASAFEETAMNFYMTLKDNVGNNLRLFVEELADEEKCHFDLFQSLKNNPLVLDKVEELIEIPQNNHHFSDYIQTPKLSEFPDDQAILQYALGQEQAAMEQYTALAQETPPGTLHEAFQYLAQEELAHKNELEKRYYELVHSGGV
jgi:rubrerythrin